MYMYVVHAVYMYTSVSTFVHYCKYLSVEYQFYIQFHVFTAETAIIKIILIITFIIIDIVHARLCLQM